MGIVKVTSRPHLYALMEDVECASPPEEVEMMAGKMQLRFSVKMNGQSTENQREIANIMSFALREKPLYVRDRGEYACWSKGFYKVGEWVVNGTEGSVDIASPLFTLSQTENILVPILALSGRYIPYETMDIYFYPEKLERQEVLNLCNIIESRNELITCALGLTEDLRIIVGHNVAFGMALDAFSFEKTEAMIYLLHQASLRAGAVSKARMKSADGSNPKFQMRSWLLRLGFIGERFERPRRTFLERLDGDGTFFTEDGRKKAYDKRRRARAEVFR